MGYCCCFAAAGNDGVSKAYLSQYTDANRQKKTDTTTSHILSFNGTTQTVGIIVVVAATIVESLESFGVVLIFYFHVLMLMLMLRFARCCTSR